MVERIRSERDVKNEQRLFFHQNKFNKANSLHVIANKDGLLNRIVHYTWQWTGTDSLMGSSKHCMTRESPEPNNPFYLSYSPNQLSILKAQAGPPPTDFSLHSPILHSTDIPMSRYWHSPKLRLCLKHLSLHCYSFIQLLLYWRRLGREIGIWVNMQRGWVNWLLLRCRVPVRVSHSFFLARSLWPEKAVWRNRLMGEHSISVKPWIMVVPDAIWCYNWSNNPAWFGCIPVNFVSLLKMG